MVSTAWRRTPHPFTTDLDVSSDAFWSKTFVERDETFAWLRKHAPVSWHPPREAPEIPEELHGETGFWAVVKNEDIAFVSENHELFSSDSEEWGGIFMRPTDPRIFGNPNFLTMDPPEQTRYRRIMSAAFTPKGVSRISDKINERAEKIIDRVVGMGGFDFVTEVSAKLPMLTVADLIGIPEDLVESFAEAGNNFANVTDPEFVPAGVDPLEFMLAQLTVLRQIGVDLVNYRREHPAEDIATALAQADFDGRKLDDNDIQSMMLLLSIAGNDTTKQTTSHTLNSLGKHPDQKAWLKEDFDGRIAGAVEEFVRHASPIIQFARTATQDVELRGRKITQGDKVVIFLCSGNRDEEVFEDAHRFDLSRDPAGHVAFGGGGVHYCLGNGIAKAQLKAIYSRVLTKLPHLQITGEPDLLFGDFINGIKHLPVYA